MLFKIRLSKAENMIKTNFTTLVTKDLPGSSNQEIIFYPILQTTYNLEQTMKNNLILMVVGLVDWLIFEMIGLFCTSQLPVDQLMTRYLFPSNQKMSHCHGLRIRYKAKKPLERDISGYELGQKYCSYCEMFVKVKVL